MGRSVSTPHNATVTTYRTLEVEADPEYLEELGIDPDDWRPDETDYQLAFDSIVEDLQEYAPTLWKSLVKCDKWLGREDHALLENEHCYIGISEYCGMVATWIVPKTEEWLNGWCHEDRARANLCESWVAQIEEKFRKTFGQYEKLGTMSNGEAVYQKAAA